MSTCGSSPNNDALVATVPVAPVDALIRGLMGKAERVAFYREAIDSGVRSSPTGTIMAPYRQRHHPRTPSTCTIPSTCGCLSIGGSAR